jgi:arylsulfatase A-like enzyme
MRLCSDLKVDPKYLEDNAALKADANEINGYNATMNRIPEAERLRMKELYAERGKIMQEQRPTGNDLLKWKYQWYMQDYLGCIASVDENIGRLLQYLDSSGLAGNTMVIYTSDQGFYLGENGWFDKRFMYDVSMQTPLMVRWPGKIKPNSTAKVLTQNIDYAPTILDAAGIKIPDWMQGISLKPVLTGKQTLLSRKSLYYHYYEYSRDHTVLPHLGIRTEKYKLIYFYSVNEWQFYDLLKDPAELQNQVNNPAYQSIVKQLKIELNKLRDQYDDHEAAGDLR